MLSAAQRFALISRSGRRPPTEIDTLRIRAGSLRDYQRLSHYHYRGGAPCVPTSVLVIEHPGRSCVERFREMRGEELHGASAGQVFGVLVRSLPRLNCSLRELATSGRYAGLEPTDRACMLNREMRTISRVVIHPAWRGLGLAVRLVKHALASAESAYTEAIAEMGRVSPFFERAGMRKYERPHHPHNARMLAALEEVGLDPALAASRVRFMERLTAMPMPKRIFIERELLCFACGSRRLSPLRRSRADLSMCLDAVREHLLSRPVYYLARAASKEVGKHEQRRVAGDRDRAAARKAGQRELHERIIAAETAAAH